MDKQTMKQSFIIATRHDDGLRKIAKQDGVSMSYHVRKALDEYLLKWFGGTLDKNSKTVSDDADDCGTPAAVEQGGE
jgi:hypothetical protein